MRIGFCIQDLYPRGLKENCATSYLHNTAKDKDYNFNINSNMVNLSPITRQKNLIYSKAFNIHALSAHVKK